MKKTHDPPQGDPRMVREISWDQDRIDELVDKMYEQTMTIPEARELISYLHEALELARELEDAPAAANLRRWKSRAEGYIELGGPGWALA